MIFINYNEVKEILLTKEYKINSLIIEGKSASGKTSLAILKYKHMINEEKISSENILIFYMNKYQNFTWNNIIDFKTIGEVNKHSYFNFIKKELITYWPLVIKECNKIKNNFIKPVFVEFDTSLYMMEMLVDYFRNKEGYFADIVSTSRKIAENIIFNINKAALSLINLSEIGDRIYNSIEVKENIQYKTYEQINKVIDHYVESYLKLGVIDYGMAIYIYNKYLLKNSVYNNYLKNIKYIIVDDFDEISPAQLELINIIAKNVKAIYLFSNPEGYFNVFNGSNKEYIKNNVKFDLKHIKLNENFGYCNKFVDFAQVLTNGLINKKSEELKSNIKAYIDVNSQLRSEMIHKIIEKIKELVLVKGKNPKEIIVISPIQDFVLNYEIYDKLAFEGIEVVSTSKKSKLIDNIYINALVIIACFCKEFYNIKLTIDDFKKFFGLILDINPIKSSIISKYIYKEQCIVSLPQHIKKVIGNEAFEKYIYLKNFIEKYKNVCKESNIPLDELFRRIFLELIIKIPKAINNIDIFQKINDLSEKFIGILIHFNTISNPEEKFIEFIKTEAKDFYSFEDIEKLYENSYSIKITNPYTFLNSNLNSKIQIWTDISSDIWAPRNIKELTNPYVLSTNWNINSIYTNEIENKNRQERLIAIVNGLLRKCSEELYIYGSQYSINGYQQESAFSNIIFDILNESGEH